MERLIWAHARPAACCWLHLFSSSPPVPLQHIRNVFYRMGLNDQAIVALSGAHTLGRARPDRRCDPPHRLPLPALVSARRPPLPLLFASTAHSLTHACRAPPNAAALARRAPSTPRRAPAPRAAPPGPCSGSSLTVSSRAPCMRSHWSSCAAARARRLLGSQPCFAIGRSARCRFLTPVPWLLTRRLLLQGHQGAAGRGAAGAAHRRLPVRG
jgi:hypothetical protein